MRRINTRDDRSADSQWHSGFCDTMNDYHPRVPRRKRKESTSAWLVALPFAVAIAVIAFIVRGVIRG